MKGGNPGCWDPLYRAGPMAGLYSLGEPPVERWGAMWCSLWATPGRAQPLLCPEMELRARPMAVGCAPSPGWAGDSDQGHRQEPGSPGGRAACSTVMQFLAELL